MATRKRKRRSDSSASFLRSYEWKKTRTDILNRDGCRCAVCGSPIKLCVHHILQRSTWPELKLCPENLVCLCQQCHTRFKRRFSAHGDPVGFWLVFQRLRPKQAEALQLKVLEEYRQRRSESAFQNIAAARENVKAPPKP